MSVIAVAHVFGVAGRATEMRDLLRSHEARVAALPGCRSMTVASSLDDPDHYVITQEWQSEEALRSYIRSGALHDLQRRLLGMATRPWRLTLHLVHQSLALDEYAPMDPRKAD